MNMILESLKDKLGILLKSDPATILKGNMLNDIIDTARAIKPKYD
ncbi:unnamed protein product, partial [marine sediment metagenome]